LHHWDIRFEPNALCWILMPETLAGLWSQRKRWARGGMEALLRYLPYLRHWRSRRMWGVYLEYLTSVVWSYLMGIIILLWLLGQLFTLPEALTIQAQLPGWNGVILGLTCLLQFAISMKMDARFEEGLGRYYYWMIWYPIAYWIINVLTTVVAVPQAIFGRRQRRGTWTSPDRGLTS
jgi:biofilm PGA synthesis N-glycosyltransferase PgaC